MDLAALHDKSPFNVVELPIKISLNFTTFYNVCFKHIFYMLYTMFLFAISQLFTCALRNARYKQHTHTKSRRI